MTLSREAKAEANRRYRARKAIAAGREPGRTGRPPTGRKTPKCHGDRRAQYRRRMERQRMHAGDNGWVETKHPLMDEAAAVAKRYAKPDHRTHYIDPLYEEALMTAALALIEGSDPHEAVKACVKTERSNRAVEAPILVDFEQGELYL